METPKSKENILTQLHSRRHFPITVMLHQYVVVVIVVVYETRVFHTINSHHGFLSLPPHNPIHPTSHLFFPHFRKQTGKYDKNKKEWKCVSIISVFFTIIVTETQETSSKQKKAKSTKSMYIYNNFVLHLEGRKIKLSSDKDIHGAKHFIGLRPVSQLNLCHQEY